MKNISVLPLGGAGEVGASSAILTIGSARILIDAGVRVSAGGRKAPLPLYELLTEPPDAVLITHAHTDHTGSLPTAVNHVGNAMIHMTTASLHLLEVLQGDAIRARASEDVPVEREGEGGRLQYTMEDVHKAVSRCEGHRYFEPFCPVPGRSDIVVEFIPCGHILGAAMMIIDAPEGRIWWTGDYSRTPQPTIGGVDFELVRRKVAERPVDLMVTEGTYGLSTHPGREAETRRFLKLLERVTARGGRVLIPAFAVGRAQDILKTVRDAKLRGRLADVPVYIDGMVRPVTAIYENIAHEAYETMREPLILCDSSLGIQKVTGNTREKLLAEEGDAAIVISSSGMLMGGRSVQYAKAFASQKKNAIFLSGYQDEESPGKALLLLKRGGRLRLGEERVKVKCQVGRYHTSAHADSNEIAELVSIVNPRVVGVVHGDPSALSAMAQRLGDRAVILVNGETLDIEANPCQAEWTPPEVSTVPSALSGVRAVARGDMPQEKEIRLLWEALTASGEREYAESEIARALLGPGYTPGTREALSHCLASHRLYFITGNKIGSRSYRPRAVDDVREMMIERHHAWQVEVHVGDVVVYSDGSPDCHVAMVSRALDDGNVEALIPFSGRTTFRREWVRCKTGVDLKSVMRTATGEYLRNWAEGLVREARDLPEADLIAAWDAARTCGRPVVAEELIEYLWPYRRGPATSAVRVGASLALAGARALFTVEADGTFAPRSEDEAVRRWPLLARIRYAQSHVGEPCDTDTGEVIVPTGDFGFDSFGVTMSDGTTGRMSYRRVLVEAEIEARQKALAMAEARARRQTQQRSNKPSRGPRRSRHRNRTESGPRETVEVESALIVAGDSGASLENAEISSKKRRRRKKRRRHGARRRSQARVQAERLQAGMEVSGSSNEGSESGAGPGMPLTVGPTPSSSPETGA